MSAQLTERLNPAKLKELTLERAREFMKNKRGRQYWRSLDQLARRDDFGAMLEQEFPRQAAGSEGVDRRDFLRFMGASLAIGGLTACTRQPVEKIVPYVKAPEDLIPGKPAFYATALSLGGYGYGLVMTSNHGRPTKAEGNPKHPASLGATDVFGQGSVYGLYDPDRSQAILNRGRPSGWDAFLKEFNAALEGVTPTAGMGLRVVSETVTSPTLAAQMKEFQTKFPQAKWIQYEPVNRDNLHAGTNLAFGEVLEPVYHLEKAKVIVSVDSDFLSFGPGHLRYARDFAAGRNTTVEASKVEMSRLYVIESGLTVTGSSADNRLPVAPSQIEGVVRALAHELGLEVSESDAGSSKHFVEALAADLKKNLGAAVVIAGEHLSPMTQALVHSINGMLKASDSTVTYHEPVEVVAGYQTESLKALADDLNAGKVDLLVLLGGNPVYYAPADLKLPAAIEKARFVVHLGLYADETAFVSHWHIPEAHFLEGWSDVRAFDGTASIVQPLIEPLYKGKSIHEMTSALLGRSAKKGYEIVKDNWAQKLGEGDAEANWRKALHDGFIAGTAGKSKAVKARNDVLSLKKIAVEGKGLELVFAPDYSTYDGRFANNGWLQETPRSTTKIVWDNALLVGPATAEKNGLNDSDVVEITTKSASLKAAVFRVPGIAENTAVLNLGYGRTKGGRVQEGSGFNACSIRSSSSPWFDFATVAKTGDHYEIVTTQHQHELPLDSEPQETSLKEFAEKPEYVQRKHNRGATLDAFKKNEHFAKKTEEAEYDENGNVISIYPDFDYSKGNQWGMVFNLSACIGCNACMIACVAENNIAVVGKDQSRRQRSMHWIRVDRYFSGDKNAPNISFQPVPCQHCENAPCEAVCPVAATTHSRDGINQMVYNRCVGTRYCSNNCPYKVRRFNFYKFSDHETPSFKLMRNPNVTVRARGVMEKCTYCIQRIAAARIEGKKKSITDAARAEHNVLPGEVVTACQQACPTKAITFGDINNEKDPVFALRNNPLNFAMIAELATRPRTTYLARVRNPNPELETKAPASAGGHV
jgi:MoCo/4Fe-4S cofactor protein with predicted Tat translocation signal